MEVAGQWRREWAGKAEYGKVTEGGVTRQVARAMEVLHASGPGSRVRVMRAAYHSSAGPGVPASSYMLHSSRRVISSGFNILESPSFETKPLEISSMPLESSPDSITETENYKVTEPDDTEISEPSKWRVSRGKGSMRMPSEESSSTDNASVIDLDSRNNQNQKNIFRKCSYDSENSDVQPIKGTNSRISPLLDAPVTLSTLKYKSLLTGSNDWNNRRKSYSFENTSPGAETLFHTNDTIAMESSTDSGICKSSEIVNDPVENDASLKYLDRGDKHHSTDETFRDWLSRNRSTFYHGNQFKYFRDHKVVHEDPSESNIILQSTGKVSINLPITLESKEDYQYKKDHGSDEGDKKIKKVEFCKTELHFAAESGKVNIIATDEKPPPSNDFRKRRSAFVPLHDIGEKPITLFGEKEDFSKTIHDEISNRNVEFSESDENTAATKSILKNKIPKPKPYLLGENMAFGPPDEATNIKHTYDGVTTPTAVSLINKQLRSKKATSDFSNELEVNIITTHAVRTNRKGPNIIEPKKLTSSTNSNSAEFNYASSLKNKLQELQLSPVPVRAKTRKLRESDLMYFGIDESKSDKVYERKQEKNKVVYPDKTDDVFHSVKLIQQISNSVCNSEAESEEAEYQNIPMKTNFTPVPTPRVRSKYDDKPNEINEIVVLKPIIERNESESERTTMESRRTRLRRLDRQIISSNRSHSEPPKSKFLEKSPRRDNHSPRDKRTIKESHSRDKNETLSNKTTKKISDEYAPIYANMANVVDQLESGNKNNKHTNRKIENIKTIRDSKLNIGNINNGTNPKVLQENLLQKQESFKKMNKPSRTERLVTPEHKSISENNNNSGNCKLKDSRKQEQSHTQRNEQTSSHEHKSRSLQRSNNKKDKQNPLEEHVASTRKKAKDDLEKNIIHRTRQPSKDEKANCNSRDNSSKTLERNTSSHVNQHQKQLNRTPRERSTTTQDTSNNNKLYNRNTRRSEYVINYDDKNGTVSTICKVKSGPTNTKKKKGPKENVIEYSKENQERKRINKISLRK